MASTLRRSLLDRLGIWVLLIGTAGLYLWNLSASGWANAFYSAAAQAGSANWEAFLYGSSDAANAITVDKPPASLWFMALAVKLFGLSSWSILVPEVLMGVASVGVLYLAVKRAFPAGSTGATKAGLLAGLALALTPVAALMFRYNNPDALLVLLMTLAAYATLRAVQSGAWRWTIMVGLLVGFGFLTKQLQVLLVVPGFALAYLLYAPVGWGKRLLQLLATGAAAVVAAGWWVLLVELTPADQRPYIGGSQSNSILELTFGYNGLGRIDGSESGSVGGNGGWGETGIGRLFSSSFGGQISWLLPAALILLVASAVLLWRQRAVPRTAESGSPVVSGASATGNSSLKASLFIWGGWLLVTAATFSFMAGIIHEYYSVALAPAIAAVVGLGAALLWERRKSPAVSLVLAGVLFVTAIWSWILLNRSSDFLPWLKWFVAGVSLVAGVGLILNAFLPVAGRRLVATVAVLAVLAGPASFTVATLTTGHSGAIVTAGPSGSSNGPGGGFAGGAQAGGRPGGTGTAGTGGGGGGIGGLLNSTTPSSELVSLLESDASKYTWAAAVVGSNNAAGYQLATQLPVMALGGFNGTDPAPTLDEFKALVAAGKIHFLIAGTISGASSSGSDAANEINSWVAANYTASTVGGVTVYNLSAS
ncbi:4-amino-4-deoxy-L-arabinose transferase-like glycosyltransferase [Psychromicrobium silvestre]|uniref:4-amino-4-deoxy-L-arabinose transferase-like glycosyltransferase n=1 Tax=Psychromicrobium silvestre TaxID=1645614 RepID=A0A7Y9S547_9MICC|nr:glycosyltransferase family 39 protein [Psychromicrobium silvestre]NYE93831.1 4-amino-4-deoxy-L-arabinose transferase-like glycosyltransferase [Psychromicrobium silvestre]